MKTKTLLSLSVAGVSLLMLPGSLQAINIYEGFDYPGDVSAPGTPEPGSSVILGNGAGGSGWNTVVKPNMPGDPSPTTRDVAAWGSFPNAFNFTPGISHQGVGGASPMRVIAPTLTAPANYGFTPTGNELYGRAFEAANAVREFDPSNYIDMDSGAPAYFSFLVSQDAIDNFNSSFSLLTFISGSPTAERLFKVGIGLGIDKAAILDGERNMAENSVLAQGTESILALTSYLVIGKLVPAGASSTVSLDFVREDELISGTESWDLSTTIDLSGVVIDRIMLQSGTSEGSDTSFAQVRRSHFDELRFGDTYASVTVPEPATVALLVGVLTLGVVLYRRRQA